MTAIQMMVKTLLRCSSRKKSSERTPSADEKFCGHCEDVLPLVEFGTFNKRRGNKVYVCRNSYCKACERARAKAERIRKAAS